MASHVFQVSPLLCCTGIRSESIHNDRRRSIFISVPAENFRENRTPPKSANNTSTTTLLRQPNMNRRMARNGHHCPQDNRGGCRWVNRPARRCTTHTYVCPIHNSVYQTYQSCLSCEGERRAAERRARAGTPEPEPSGTRNNQRRNNFSEQRVAIPALASSSACSQTTADFTASRNTGPITDVFTQNFLFLTLLHILSSWPVTT